MRTASLMYERFRRSYHSFIAMATNSQVTVLVQYILGVAGVADGVCPKPTNGASLNAHGTFARRVTVTDLMYYCNRPSKRPLLSNRPQRFKTKSLSAPISKNKQIHSKRSPLYTCQLGQEKIF